MAGGTFSRLEARGHARALACATTEEWWHGRFGLANGGARRRWDWVAPLKALRLGTARVLVRTAECALDTDTLISALDKGERAALDKALAGRAPVLSIRTARDYLRPSKQSCTKGLDHFVRERLSWS